MKKTYFYLFILLFFTQYSYSQILKKSDDVLIRASYASYYIEEVKEENYMFDTPLGEAVANIILKNYRDLLPIPEISNIQLNINDRAKIEQLIRRLNQLRLAPPTWEEIIYFEKDKLIQWDKAVRKKSIYKSY
jgi:hypothetical protein